MSSTRVGVFCFPAAALLVVAASGQPALASIICFDDGQNHDCSADALSGTVELTNDSSLFVSGGSSGGSCDSFSLFVGSGCVFTYDPLPPPPADPLGPIASVPEPSTIIIWSLLGGLGIAIGCCRR